MWMIDPTLGSFLINSTILSVFMACACLKRSNFLKIKKSTTVIHVMHDHQTVTGWMKQAFAVSPYRCLYGDMHGWIFGTFHMNKTSAEFVNAAGEYVDCIACSYNTYRKLHALATKTAWTKISFWSFWLRYTSNKHTHTHRFHGAESKTIHISQCQTSDALSYFYFYPSIRPKDLK